MIRTSTLLLPALFAALSPAAIHAQEPIAPASLPDVRVIAIGSMDGEFGDVFADDLAFALLDGGRFRVVDRERTADLMQEHRIRSTGLISPQDAVRLGEFTGAEAYVFGRVVDVREERYRSPLGLPETRVTVEVQARVIDLRTSEVLASRHVVRSMTSASDVRGTAVDAGAALLFGRRRVERTAADPVQLRTRAFQAAAADFADALQR
jgi:curli biogenesis system outer membrane secretion channel CsgG